MNIKLKALLLALGFVAAPFVFLYIMFMYPLLILVTAVAAIVYMVYNLVLSKLEREHTKTKGGSQ